MTDEIRRSQSRKKAYIYITYLHQILKRLIFHFNGYMLGTIILVSPLLLHTLWRSEVYWRPGATSNHDAHSLFTYQNKGYLHTTGEFVTIPTNLSAKPPTPPMLPYIPDKQ